MLRLREIGSRHNSYINMILRQVAFSILTAYFQGRQMSDVSMGGTESEWLTVFFQFCPQRRRNPFCREDLDGRKEGYIKLWEEVF